MKKNMKKNNFNYKTHHRICFMRYINRYYILNNIKSYSNPYLFYNLIIYNIYNIYLNYTFIKFK